MNFIDRLFDPERLTLKLKLQQAEVERDWYRDRCGEMVLLVEKRNTELRAEYKRNRSREDALSNQGVEIAGGRRLPAREPDKPIDEPDEPKKLSPSDDDRLRDMAKQYAEQKHPHGEPSEQDIENAYQTMLPRAEEWLDN